MQMHLRYLCASICERQPPAISRLMQRHIEQAPQGLIPLRRNVHFAEQIEQTAVIRSPPYAGTARTTPEGLRLAARIPGVGHARHNEAVQPRSPLPLRCRLRCLGGLPKQRQPILLRIRVLCPLLKVPSQPTRLPNPLQQRPKLQPNGRVVHVCRDYLLQLAYREFRIRELRIRQHRRVGQRLLRHLVRGKPRHLLPL